MFQSTDITSPTTVPGQGARSLEQFVPQKDQWIPAIMDESLPLHVRLASLARGAQYAPFEPRFFTGSPDYADGTFTPERADEADARLREAVRVGRLPVFHPVPRAKTSIQSTEVSVEASQAQSRSKPGHARAPQQSLHARPPLAAYTGPPAASRIFPSQAPQVSPQGPNILHPQFRHPGVQDGQYPHFRSGASQYRPSNSQPSGPVVQQQLASHLALNQMQQAYAGQPMASSSSREVDKGPVIHVPIIDCKEIKTVMIPGMHEKLSRHPSKYPLTPERFGFLSADWLDGVLDPVRPNTISIQKAPYKPYHATFWLYRPQRILELRSQIPEMRAKLYDLFHSLANTMREDSPKSTPYRSAFLEVYNQSWMLSMREAQWYAQFEDSRKLSAKQRMARWDSVTTRQARETPWPSARPHALHSRPHTLDSRKSTQAPSSISSSVEAGANADMPLIIEDDDQPADAPVIYGTAAPTPSQVANPEGNKRKRTPVEETEEERESKRLRTERIESKEAKWAALQDQIEPWWRAKFPNAPVKTIWFVKLDAWERKEAGEESRKNVYEVQKPVIDKWFSKKRDGKPQPTEWQIRLEMWEKANRQKNLKKAA